MKVSIDKEKYSESSKRSIGHEFLGEYYKDIKYICFKCSQKAIYKALEQKEAIEVRKEYMWRQRVLCNVCWKEMRDIKKDLAEMESQYSNNKQASLNDTDFLNKWLELLKQYLLYSKKGNTSRIVFIERHLKNA